MSDTSSIPEHYNEKLRGTHRAHSRLFWLANSMSKVSQEKGLTWHRFSPRESDAHMDPDVMDGLFDGMDDPPDCYQVVQVVTKGRSKSLVLPPNGVPKLVENRSLYHSLPIGDLTLGNIVAIVTHALVVNDSLMKRLSGGESICLNTEESPVMIDHFELTVDDDDEKSMTPQDSLTLHYRRHASRSDTTSSLMFSMDDDLNTSVIASVDDMAVQKYLNIFKHPSLRLTATLVKQKNELMRQVEQLNIKLMSIREQMRKKRSSILVNAPSGLPRQLTNIDQHLEIENLLAEIEFLNRENTALKAHDKSTIGRAVSSSDIHQTPRKKKSETKARDSEEDDWRSSDDDETPTGKRSRKELEQMVMKLEHENDRLNQAIDDGSLDRSLFAEQIDRLQYQLSQTRQENAQLSRKMDELKSQMDPTVVMMHTENMMMTPLPRRRNSLSITSAAQMEAMTVMSGRRFPSIHEICHSFHSFRVNQYETLLNYLVDNDKTETERSSSKRKYFELLFGLFWNVHAFYQQRHSSIFRTVPENIIHMDTKSFRDSFLPHFQSNYLDFLALKVLHARLAQDDVFQDFEEIPFFKEFVDKAAQICWSVVLTSSKRLRFAPREFLADDLSHGFSDTGLTVYERSTGASALFFVLPGIVDEGNLPVSREAKPVVFLGDAESRVSRSLDHFEQVKMDGGSDDSYELVSAEAGVYGSS